jgi:hypothetical protein
MTPDTLTAFIRASRAASEGMDAQAEYRAQKAAYDAVCIRGATKDRQRAWDALHEANSAALRADMRAGE